MVLVHFAMQNAPIDLGSMMANSQSFYGRITILPQLRETP
jgi:hypothetical protein